jgi:hypothetical protein
MGAKEDFSQGLKLETSESIRGNLAEAKNPVSLYKKAIEVLGKMERNFDNALGNNPYDYFDGNVETEVDKTEFENNAEDLLKRANQLCEEIELNSALLSLAQELLLSQEESVKKVEKDLEDGRLDDLNHIEFTSTPQEIIHTKEIIDRFGSSLEINVANQDIASLRVHIEDLGLIPVVMLKILEKKGLRIIIGDKTMTRFSDDDRFKHAPRGWTVSDWSRVPGAYDSLEKIVYAGDNKLHGCLSLALHEYGHAAGDLLNLDNSKIVIQAHKRLYNKLTAYKQQGGPGGSAGRKELLAESFEDYFKKNKREFIEEYDEKWYKFISNAINNPNSII